MTFRPSDDVLDEISTGQQNLLSWEENNVNIQGDWQYTPMDFGSNWNTEVAALDGGQEIINAWVEMVKAPDLSELLKNNDNIDNEEKNENDSEIDTDNLPKDTVSDQSLWNEANEIQVQNNEISQQSDESDFTEYGKIPDAERSIMVSWIEGSINSDLDLLVDNNWVNIVETYKKINRLFFRWWASAFFMIIGIVSWVFLQVRAWNTNNIGMVNDSSIENKNNWQENTPDKILSSLSESWVDVKVLIPYGSASANSTSFQSKSNLISYKWLILPQLSSIDFNSEDFLSLEDFDAHKVSRKDIENAMNLLIKNNSTYRKTTNLPNAKDLRRVGKSLEWSLIDWFNLWCINSSKASNFVCDEFLEVFYKYGKYYDLNKYSSEILELIIKLKKEGKDVEPICNMVNEYVLHSGITSDNLTSTMNYCKKEDLDFYNKMIKFIEVENSLWMPELSNKVFEDPDLNAYKLLSAQQSVYKFLWGVSFNVNYTKSYLNFVQALINKDKGSNRYIHPFYKDLLYVFNSDELYPFLIKNSYTDLKLQIDQINKWNSMYGYSSLLSQLTTDDIEWSWMNITGVVINQKTVEEIFSQYYSMTDRLKIRKVDIVSDELIKLQTEVFTEKIFRVTDGETLKVTATMHRMDNSLYVDSIKVANQPRLSEILNIYVSEWDVTFNAILSYIEEKVWMWYEVNPENLEPQPTFCETISEREDIAVYTCDDSSISVYKWDVEYNFTLTNWILNSFTISDKNLEQIIKTKLDGVMVMRDSTPSIITSIIDFTVESKDDNIEKKLRIIDQFRIHFKLVPDDIHDIEWKSDVFLIYFTLWEFKLQAYYDINTQTLTKISYANCGERQLEIKKLSIEVTANNEPELMEILNNPKVYFARVNPTIYKKYQKVCGWNK